MKLTDFTEHRPWPILKSPWIMKQIWHDLLFAHWPVKKSDLNLLLPQGLELDLWEDRPWISIVPFHMSGIRLRGLPPIPYTDRFPELNVRTYVTLNGKPGVYFFSLDASHWLAVETARTLFHLPYMHAQMSVDAAGESIRYNSNRTDRRGSSAVFSGTYRATDSEIFHAERGTLIHWLTERYCLYSSNKKDEIFIAEIHHKPWGLQQAEYHSYTNTMAESHGIVLPEINPVLTYTKRLEVLVWPLKKVMKIK